MNHNLYEVINTEIQQFYTQAKGELKKSMAYKIYAYISLTYTGRIREEQTKNQINSFPDKNHLKCVLKRHGPNLATSSPCNAALQN